MVKVKCTEQIIGTVFCVTGFWIAGSMFIMIARKYSWIEVEDSDEEELDNMEIQKLLWVYALALILALIGVLVKSSEELCDQRKWIEDWESKFEYFGVLLQLIGLLGLSASGMGMATYYDNSRNFSQALASSAADQRTIFGFFSASASLLSLAGFFFSLNEPICCSKKFSWNKDSIFNLSNMLLSMFLALFWFIWADSQTTTFDGSDDDLSKYCNLIGVVLLIFGFVGVLDCFGRKDDEVGESN